MTADDTQRSHRTRVPRLPALPDGLGEALWLFLVLRVGLGVFALFVWAHVQIPTSCHFELARDNWTSIPPLANTGPEFPLVGVWQRWDACWYSKVATFGYELGADSPNFWPVLPALMRLVALPLGGDVALGGLIVVGAAYVAAIAGLFRLVARDLGRDVAERTVLFISIAPAAFFLFAPFTEAPFLAFTVWAILAARERSWMLAAVVGLLAGLTRIQGVFLVPPIAWEAWLAWHERWAPANAQDPSKPDGPAPARPLPKVSSLLAVAAPAIGFGSFIAATALVVGRTPLDTQDAWGGRNFHPPWEVVDAALRWIADRHDSLEALNLVMLVLFVVLVVAGLRRLPLSYSLFAVPQVALVAVRIQPTPLTSTARLMEVVFPAFVVLALATGGRRRFLTWTVVSTLALAALTWLFVIGDWVA
jgi:hypothetical protein